VRVADYALQPSGSLAYKQCVRATQHKKFSKR
jgi:hypothetical protein